MLVDLLVDVATLIEATVAFEKVSVTLPDPPQTDRCSAAYVWGTQIFDADVSTQQRGDIPGCAYQRAYVISYRLDFCLSPQKTEKTTAEQLAEATTLYNAGDNVICALMAAASAGTLFDTLDTCEDIAISPLVFQAPQGDRVSAVGQIRVSDPCPPAGS